MEEIIYCEHGEALVQVVQRSCGCPIPEGVQDQADWGSGLVEGVSARGREVGTRSLPTQIIL